MVRRSLCLSVLMGACGGCGPSAPGDGTAEGTAAESSTASTAATSAMPTTGADGETTADVTDGSAGESSTTGPPTCELPVDVSAVRPRVMLVLDKSGSMAAAPNGFWDHDGDDADDDGIVDGDPNMAAATPRVTRWQSLHESLAAVLEEFDERVDFGLMLFPFRDVVPDWGGSACVVEDMPEVPVGPAQAATILATMPAADDTNIKGATPTTAAVLRAIEGLASDDPVVADRPRAMLLITDGPANCQEGAPDQDALFEVYDEQLPGVVAGAFAAGTPTHVVGLAIQDEVTPTMKDGHPDGINPLEKLNEVAEAGGVPRPGDVKFFQSTDQATLAANLHEVVAGISAGATSCVLPVEVFNPTIPVVEVVVDPQGAPLQFDEQQVTDCAGESGWRQVDAEILIIELCGEACERFKSAGEATVTLSCSG